MGKGRTIALLALVLAALAASACNQGSTPVAVDDRERQVLVGFSVTAPAGGAKAAQTTQYSWLPGVAVGGDKVVAAYDTRAMPEPAEIIVAWPDGSTTQAEIDEVRLDYRIISILAPGGPRYPELGQASAMPASGEEVTVWAYSEPWYWLGKGITDEPRPPEGLPALVALEATVLSPDSLLDPRMAAEAGVAENAPYLVVEADNPSGAGTLGSVIVHGDRMVGLTVQTMVVSSNRSRNELWAVPLGALQAPR